MPASLTTFNDMFQCSVVSL